MHPIVMYELATIKVAELQVEAGSQRRARLARQGASLEPRGIDTPSVVERVKELLFGSPPSARTPATAGA